MTQKPRSFLHPLLNEREVAALLGVSVRTIQEWRQSGHGPPFLKLSRRKRGAVRYAPADVRAFVQERRARTLEEGNSLTRRELPTDRRPRQR